jgi:hypothetical protein
VVSAAVFFVAVVAAVESVAEVAVHAADFVLVVASLEVAAVVVVVVVLVVVDDDED